MSPTQLKAPLPPLTATSQVESPYAWLRLFASLAIMTIGCVGMYGVTVVLPRIQNDFGVARSDASLPYTLTMIGFGLGGIWMGKLSDRYGVMLPTLVGAVGLGLGFVAASQAASVWQFSLVQGLLIGLMGTSATFAPLVADTSRWFNRRRGIALAICMSGNYLAGAIWPPIIQHLIDSNGWRTTYMGIGIFCLLSIVALAGLLHRRPPDLQTSVPTTLAPHLKAHANPDRPLGLSPAWLQTLLCVAGVSCCVAMSMPQVHIVAYCSDLGFGAARGAEMLSLMLGMGVASRLISGWISDHLGGLRTLLLGSVLQGVALLMFLPFDGLVPLYLISAMFGLFQGGIVPSYALIVREYFNPKEAGSRVGTVLMSTLLGMALGGWLSGLMFDLTGSYHAAFINGIAFNLINVSVVIYLLYRTRKV